MADSFEVTSQHPPCSHSCSLLPSCNWVGLRSQWNTAASMVFCSAQASVSVAFLLSGHLGWVKVRALLRALYTQKLKPLPVIMRLHLETDASTSVQPSDDLRPGQRQCDHLLIEHHSWKQLVQPPQYVRRFKLLFCGCLPWYSSTIRRDALLL